MGLTVSIANVAIYGSKRLDRAWANIGIRVLASWIAAVALMVVALELR